MTAMGNGMMISDDWFADADTIKCAFALARGLADGLGEEKKAKVRA